MLNHKVCKTAKGFTIVELLVVMTLISITMVMFSSFFVNSYAAYVNLQANTIRMNDLSAGMQRVARVLRGLNSITDAGDYSLSGFAYFTPRDAALSKVRYFYDTSSHSVKVGVIAASGTAPGYTYPVATEKIFKIIDNIDNTQPIFSYLNLDGERATFTPDSYKDIQGIEISLTNQSLGKELPAYHLDTAVSLRNRKSNL